MIITHNTEDLGGLHKTKTMRVNASITEAQQRFSPVSNNSQCVDLTHAGAKKSRIKHEHKRHGTSPQTSDIPSTSETIRTADRLHTPSA